MEFRTRIVCIAMTLGVVAACNGGEAVAPDAPDVPLIPAAEGNVNWFCWIDGGTGEIHSCEFWCAEEDEWLQHDANGDLICGGSSGPNADDPDDPGEPGPGGGGTLETDTATITLSCDKGVTRGDTGGCTLSYPSWTPISNIRWQSVIPDVSPNQWGGDSYRGEIVIDTPVEVTYDLAGQPAQTRMDVVTVASRSWDWSTAWQYHEGAAPDCETSLHHAITQTTGLGWIIGLSCAKPTIMFNPDPTSPSTFSVAPVQGGPNDGLWYLTSPPMRMDLKSQILPDLRGQHQYPVGSGSPSAVRDNCPSQVTLPGVNTCADTPGNMFSTMVSNIWAHERAHYDLAVVEAGKAENDLWGNLEDEVRTSESALRSGLLTITDIINRRVLDAAETADTGTHGPYPFYGYVAGSSGTWQWVTWTLGGVLQ